MRTVAAYLIFLLTSACATSPIKFSAATPVPEERVLTRPKVQGDQTSTMVFVRDSGWLDGIVWLVLKIDGVTVAKFNPGERLEIDVTPGKHLLTVVRSTTNDGPAEVETTVAAGERRFFRMGMGHPSGGSPLILQASSEIAD